MANIEIWNVASETLIHRFDEVEVQRIALSPDGRLLAGIDGETVRLFDMESYEETPGIEGTDGQEMMYLDFSPDSRYLAAGFGDGLVLVWDVDTRQTVFTYAEQEQGCSGAYNVSFFPDGNYLAGGNDGCLRVWNLESGEDILNTQPGRWHKRGGIVEIAISSDGAYLALGNSGAKIIVFDTETWEWIEDFEGYSLKEDKPVSALTFLPGSSILVGNTQDKLCFWDIETGKELECMKMRPQKIMAFPDGKSLAIWGDDGISLVNIEEYIKQ